jgi:hypothetical protein
MHLSGHVLEGVHVIATVALRKRARCRLQRAAGANAIVRSARGSNNRADSDVAQRSTRHYAVEDDRSNRDDGSEVSVVASSTRRPRPPTAVSRCPGPDVRPASTVRPIVVTNGS